MNKKEALQVCALIESLGYIVVISKQDGSISYVSDHIEKLVGWKPEEIAVKDGSFKHTHPDDVAKTIEAIKQASSSNGFVPGIEVRTICKDKSIRPFTWYTKLIGTDIYSIGIPEVRTDVTYDADIKRAKADVKALIFQMKTSLGGVSRD